MAASRNVGSTGGSRPSSRGKNGRFALWCFVGFVVLVVDQLTKLWAERTFEPGTYLPVFKGFNLLIAHNTGAAFSFLADAGGWQRWLFSGLAAAVIVAVVVLVRRHADKTLFSLALTLIAAGALGNLIDRSVHGYVIDFIDLYWNEWHWPAFNVADIAICAGAAGVVLDELRGVSKGR